jgi:hypothetical protein
MKKLIIALALILATTANAQSLKITESSDGEQWYGYPTTFMMSPTGLIKMTVERRIQGQPTAVVDIATNKNTCSVGEGDLLFNASSGWINAHKAVIGNDNIGDHLARSLCIVLSVLGPSKYI